MVVINLDYTGISKIKSFKLESYLTNIKSHLHRKAFCQFRISVHSIMCEIGRYYNIPYEQWFCPLCEMNKVESEHHFIFEGSYYSDLRNLLSTQLTKDRDHHPVRHMYSLLSSSSLQYRPNWLRLFSKPSKNVNNLKCIPV